MANFESGVSGYIKASCTVEVGFPVDMKGNADISCRRCRFFQMRSYVSTCVITSEIVPYPDKYVGNECPLKTEGEIIDGNTCPDTW